MKTEIEIQQENVKKLIQLMTENPELRVVPMVDSEVIQDDGFSYWCGSFNTSEIDYLFNNGEEIYFKSVSEEDLVQREINNIEAETQLYHESHPLFQSVEERAKSRVDAYAWEKVIVLWIGTL